MWEKHIFPTVLSASKRLFQSTPSTACISNIYVRH